MAQTFNPIGFFFVTHFKHGPEKNSDQCQKRGSLHINLHESERKENSLQRCGRMTSLPLGKSFPLLSISFVRKPFSEGLMSQSQKVVNRPNNQKEGHMLVTADVPKIALVTVCAFFTHFVLKRCLFCQNVFSNPIPLSLFAFQGMCSCSELHVIFSSASCFCAQVKHEEG